MASKYIDFNLNEYIRFKPSNEAILEHRDKRRRFWESSMHRMDKKQVADLMQWGELKLDADGWCEMQGWKFLGEFGHMFEHALGQEPKVGINIQFKVTD